MSTETTTKTEALANLPKGTDLKSLNKTLDYLETMLDDPNEVLSTDTRRYLVSLRNLTLKERNKLQKKKYATEHAALSEEEEVEILSEEPKPKVSKPKTDAGSSRSDEPAGEKTKKKKPAKKKIPESTGEKVEEKEESFDWANGLFGKSWS